MRTKKMIKSSQDVTHKMQEEMEKYGIVRFPVYFYQFGEHRYSNLKDAIAQAERERSEI